MKIENTGRIQRKLKALPDEIRLDVTKELSNQTHRGARVATTLAPDVTHETRGNIHPVISDDGMRGEIVAIRSDAPREDKDRAYSIEHGRKKGQRGTTAGYHYMKRTRQYLRKRWRDAMLRVVRKAARRAMKNA